ncbi:RNA-binding protein RO60-like [Dreissena polymorpha]|uniref:RNA-binding protein RO60-like n=1 Tax=Dreissena polymorpha TaxID=45954 RepID=UPI0022646651|nr:RNA-binding protein RO60-like [Dreissena polymorpha]
MQPTGDLVPQSRPLYQAIHGPGQVMNNAGGYVFTMDDMDRCRRFLIMGTEGGTYYAKETDLKRGNVQCIDRLISDGRGREAVEAIRDISINRRNVRQNSLLYAYAICCRSNNKEVKKLAYSYLSEICRIPTHLFMFIKFCEEESRGEGEPATGTGWGRAHKRAVAKWYTNFINNPEKLARLVTKYKNREGWTHKDLLRLAHVSTKDPVVGFILRYIVKGYAKAQEMYICNTARQTDEIARLAMLEGVNNLIQGVDQASATTDPNQLCELIEKYQLNWEHCPSQLLRSPEVWRQLLKKMPIEAMVRNLGRMTELKLFEGEGGKESLDLVLDKLRSINTEAEVPMEEEGDSGEGPSRGHRVNFLHPFKILLALEAYRKVEESGKKGKLTWTPNQQIVDALDSAFYQAFSQVTPTGKNYYLGVDVSGSMGVPVLGSSVITCQMAAAAMMMTTVRTEENCKIRAFSDRMVPLEIKRDDKMQTVLDKMRDMTFGSTDCSVPMKDAIENKWQDIDVFMVFTDCETWIGNVHPCQALVEYRKYSGKRDVKLIVCGMTATEFTIADKDDKYMLDIAGFDSSAPELIERFSRGEV